MTVVLERERRIIKGKVGAHVDGVVWIQGKQRGEESNYEKVDIVASTCFPPPSLSFSAVLLKTVGPRLSHDHVGIPRLPMIKLVIPGHHVIRIVIPGLHMIRLVIRLVIPGLPILRLVIPGLHVIIFVILGLCNHIGDRRPFMNIG